MPDLALVPEWTLGWRLQRALSHAGISVNDMARDLGMSRATISRWINDKGAPPRDIYVKEWALRCRVSYQWLRFGHVPAGQGPTGPGLSFTWNNSCNSPKPAGNRNIKDRVTILPRPLTLPEAA